MFFGKQNKRTAVAVASTLLFALVSALLVDFALQQTNSDCAPPAVQLIDTPDVVKNDYIAHGIGTDGGSPKLRLVWVIGLEKNGHHMMQDFFMALQKTLRRSSAKSEANRRVVTAKEVNAWKRLVVLNFEGSFVRMLRSKWCPRLGDIQSGVHAGFGFADFGIGLLRKKGEGKMGGRIVEMRKERMEKRRQANGGDEQQSLDDDSGPRNAHRHDEEEEDDARVLKQKQKKKYSTKHSSEKMREKGKSLEDESRGHRKEHTADDSSAGSRAIAEAIAKYGEDKVMAMLNAKQSKLEQKKRRSREKVKVKKERVGKWQPEEVEEDDEDEEHEYVDGDDDDEEEDDLDEDDDDDYSDAAESDARRLAEDSSEIVRNFRKQRHNEMKRKHNERLTKEMKKTYKTKKKKNRAQKKKEKKEKRKKKREKEDPSVRKERRRRQKHEGQATVERNLHRCFEMFVHGQNARQYALAGSNILGCLSTVQMPLEKGTLVVLPWPSFPFRRDGCYPNIGHMLEMSVALKHPFDFHIIRLRRKPVEGIVSNCIRKTVDAKILPLSARDKESTKFIMKQQSNCNKTIDSTKKALDEMENQLAAIDWDTDNVTMSEVDYNQFTDRSDTKYLSELLTEWSELFGFRFEDLMNTYEQTVANKGKLQPARVKFDGSRISDGITEEYLQSPDWGYLTKELQRRVLDTFY